jgi:hypothetical protein
MHVPFIKNATAEFTRVGVGECVSSSAAGMLSAGNDLQAQNSGLPGFNNWATDPGTRTDVTHETLESILGGK